MSIITTWRTCRRTPPEDKQQNRDKVQQPADAKQRWAFCIQANYMERHVSSEATIDFAKMDGLVPAIVQDSASREVLMVGFFNEESYRRTVESGFVTFWSRTRQKLWMKGETSGNRLRVVKAFTDCDQDTLLFEVIVEGDGLVCHEGTVSCFTRPIPMEAATEVRA
jgi:phosphoribosyl-ATP pyrophosphohydrolase/phosphoribosyl-AMP cyclohydrolase